ncbi:MAG TPA: acetate/propionate family kinase, partial [Firmicutes bacterium]|nr:acetate/propionate family kinase [Bacillota bacterium]
YAIPYEYYTQDGIRRYGFHGTSHSYVSKRAAEILDLPIEVLKIVTCHLGNGSSVDAIAGGKSIETSMGFTPLDGLPMGTRCGSIDVSIIEYLMENHNMTIDEVMNILNKKSGMLGVSGVSSDFRDLEKAADEGNERAKLAIDMFCYKTHKRIGSAAAAMNGIDVLIFTAGVGENSPELREKIASGLDFMGVKIDHTRNMVRGKEAIVSTDDSRVKILVIPTNEELVIAQDTASIASGK